jgi:conjugative relaxase-like TrwC/TraI family protein
MHQGCLVGPAGPRTGNPVLSIAKLRVDAEAYYLGLVVQGADEYYSEAGEVPGRWVGAGIEALGLSGQVGGEDLRVILAGRHPQTGETLCRSPRRVPGFDLTFSAPKSVSVLFALANRDLALRVVAAHDVAVQAALGYLEREACMVRRGHAGARQIQADGLAGAAFRHRTSRAGDPQVHTHVLVANLARGADGTWSAFDARLIYRQLRTAGYLYQAQLRYELSSRLGLAWDSVVRGSAELEGIRKPVLRAFSQRRAEIEEAMAQHGATTRQGAQIATLATRRPKDHDVYPALLRAEWRQRAAALGFERADALALLAQAVAPALAVIDAAELADAITLETATFHRRDVIRVFAERSPSGGPVSDLERLADQFLAEPAVVPLANDLFTTRQMLRLEQAVITNARNRLGAAVGMVPDELTDAALQARPRLSQEQRHMVAELTSSGRGIDVVLGVAGAGKTDALGAAHAAWHASGHPVIGAALAARAAAELHDRTGMPAGTLDALLHDLDQPGHQLPGRAVIVVDEAAMIGTRKLARLLAHADTSDAKVVLVGDPRQLPEIEAGGAYAGLAQHLPAIMLVENRRQRDPVDRKALAELRRGNARAAINRLRREGRITTAEAPDQARQRMVTDWHAARQKGHDAVMLAVRRSDVDQLNQAARATLVAAGQVQRDGISAGGRNFAVGDRVMGLSNRRYLGIINGDRATITATRPQSVDVALDRGPTVSLPRPYLEAGHLTHAYALTVHKAQGMTCDRALVLASGTLYREAGYTALSRGRIENRLYVPQPEPHRVDVGHGVRGYTDDATAKLVASLEASQRKHLALEERHLARSLRTPGRTPAPTIALER